jgi:hypothetical protein
MQSTQIIKPFMLNSDHNTVYNYFTIIQNSNNKSKARSKFKTPKQPIGNTIFMSEEDLIGGKKQRSKKRRSKKNKRRRTKRILK